MKKQEHGGINTRTLVLVARTVLSPCTIITHTQAHRHTSTHILKTISCTHAYPCSHTETQGHVQAHMYEDLGARVLCIPPAGRKIIQPMRLLERYLKFQCLNVFYTMTGWKAIQCIYYLAEILGRIFFSEASRHLEWTLWTPGTWEAGPHCRVGRVGNDSKNSDSNLVL